MLIFCDESGDPGLSTKSGSSFYFAVAMLYCADGETAARLADAQEKTRAGLRWSGEFKWAKMPSDVRMPYLTAMAPFLIAHRVAIWNKKHGPLPSGCRPEVAVMLHCYNAFGFKKPAVRIVIDGERDRLRSSEIRAALGAREVRMEKSHACPQLQMADMLVGFHAYAWREGWRNVPKGLHHLEANLRWCR